MTTEPKSLEDRLEEAWQNGEISHADACAELEESERC